MRENEGPERRRRDYAAWLCADTSWQVGSGVGTFALMMVALDLTGSSVKAGWVATTAGAVAALMALPGGAIVDRRDRRWCLTVAGLARAGLYGVVLLLLATGHVTLGALVLCGGLAGLITGLFGTASDAALPDVVGREDVPRAVTLNRGRDGVVSLLNEPLSGALLGAASWLPFAVTVLGAVGQVLGIRLVRADLSAQHEAEAEKDAGRVRSAPLSTWRPARSTLGTTRTRRTRRTRFTGSRWFVCSSGPSRWPFSAPPSSSICR